MRRHGLASMALICGLVVVAIAQRLAPVGGPPLYDGVVVADPYKWLSPPPGLSGGAQSVVQAIPLAGGQDGELAIGTLEVPPQAQVIADFGSLDLPAGTTTITVSVAPVPAPDVLPPKGVVAGNVYQLSVTNQRSAVVGIQAGSKVTMLFRGPTSLPSATIEYFSGGSWTAVPTDPAGIPDMFTAVVGSFGEYALVAPSGWVPAGERSLPSASSVATAEATAAGPAASATLAGPAASATAAASSAPVESVGAVGTPTPAGNTGGSGSSLPPIAAAVIALLVVVAAALVLLRPIKPPRDGDAE